MCSECRLSKPLQLPCPRGDTVVDTDLPAVATRSASSVVTGARGGSPAAASHASVANGQEMGQDEVLLQWRSFGRNQSAAAEASCERLPRIDTDGGRCAFAAARTRCAAGTPIRLLHATVMWGQVAVDPAPADSSLSGQSAAATVTAGKIASPAPPVTGWSG